MGWYRDTVGSTENNLGWRSDSLQGSDTVHTEFGNSKPRQWETAELHRQNMQTRTWRLKARSPER